MCAIISWQATVSFIQVDSLDLALILWNHGPFSQIYLPYTAQCSPSSQIPPMMVRTKRRTDVGKVLFFIKNKSSLSADGCNESWCCMCLCVRIDWPAHLSYHQFYIKHLCGSSVAFLQLLCLLNHLQYRFSSVQEQARLPWGISFSLGICKIFVASPNSCLHETWEKFVVFFFFNTSTLCQIWLKQAIWLK